MATASNRFFEQARPGSTWKTIYTAVGGEILYYLNVANVESIDCEWYFCIARNGESYKKSNALVWAESIQSNDTDVWGYQIPLIKGMRLGVLASKNKACNFTAYGMFQ